MTILKVDTKAKMAYVEFPKGLQMWLTAAMLKQYGIKWSQVKVGAKF